MLFMTLAGLWAIWRRSITITESIRLEGRPARLYGVTLLASAVLLWLVAPGRLLLETLLESAAARIALNAGIAAALIVGLVFPFHARGAAR